MPLSRKRSAIFLDGDDAAESQAASLFVQDEPVKRTQTVNELDALDIIPEAEAWPIDVASILSSPIVYGAPGGEPLALDNSRSYVQNRSMYIFCVQGDYQLHYELLCSMLPELYKLSPSLQAFVLCRDPNTHTPSSSTPVSLPMIQAVGSNYNHFVRLGLLHPIGGGHCPLDAITVLDARGRRRLVLPFGWGAGRHAANVGGGKFVQDRMMTLLRQCIESLQRESQGLVIGL